MAGNKVQVLLGLRDAVHFAPLAQALMQAGVTASLVQVGSAGQLLDHLSAAPPALLVLELDASAEVLERLRQSYPHLPVVVLLTKPTPEVAFAISRLGADDLLTLPLDQETLAERLQTVLDRLKKIVPYGAGDGHHSAIQGRLNGEAAGDRIEDPSLLRPPVFVGANPRIAEIRDTIEKVAGTDATVLIRGESGVGKEIVAQLIFEGSRRTERPFVKVNCAAIPNDLLESELFGYEPGAFTGAVRSKPGKFEIADHGTLFLDEIGEMHPMLQAKLLHVLQDGTFSRLGAKRDVSVDVRVVCATNKSLQERVAAGLFREDLLYRINVVTIWVPPLRERIDELPVLTGYFLRKYAAQYGREARSFSNEVLDRMREYDWPGNVRELENLCKRFVIVGSQTQILRELTSHSESRSATDEQPTPREANGRHSHAAGSTEPQDVTGSTETATLSLLEIGRRAAFNAERHAILKMLERTHWNRREAARQLHVSYKALLNKIKQMQLEGKNGR